MNKKNVEILLLKESDIDEVVGFYNFLYKETRTKEKFLWEFNAPPAGKAIYVIAKDIDSGKIVGTQCVIPIYLTLFNGKKILSGKSEDTLLDPNYRGLHIFEKMYTLLFEECKKNGVNYIWGFTSAKKPFLKLGFSIPFDHSQSLSVINILPSYRYISQLNQQNSFIKLFKVFALCVIAKVMSIKRFIHVGKIEFDCAVKDKSYTRKETEIIENPINKGFMILQDTSFLKWRITQNPYHKKLINIIFSSKSKVVADLIFNHHKNGVWYLINDSYGNEISLHQRIALFNAGVKKLLQHEKGVNLVRTWDFTHNTYGQEEVLMRKKVGFVHLDKGISFVWKSLHSDDSLDVKDIVLSRIASQGVI